MSSKTNKSINSALGILGETTTIKFDTTATIASGLILGDGVYRFDTDENCSLEVQPTNLGLCDVSISATLFGGVPEVLSTPADVTGDPATASIHVLVSGQDSAGTLHVTKLNTRGE